MMMMMTLTIKRKHTENDQVSGWFSLHFLKSKPRPVAQVTHFWEQIPVAFQIFAAGTGLT